MCENKNIFNFFEVKNCLDCQYHKEDEFITIGNNNINIYYLRYCFNKRLDLNLLFNDSKKVKLFLKDAIINYNDNIILILDDFNLNNTMDDLELLLQIGFDIQILVI